MKKWSLFTLVLSLLFVLAACGTNSDKDSNTNGATGTDADKPATEETTPVSIKHELDEEEVVFEKTPEKVVVFDFGVLDTLDELNIPVAGLPQATIPQYLEKYKSDEYENLGSLKEPDFEAIHAMQPDVIFISGRQSDLYEEFKKIAPTVYMGVDYTNYMDSFTSNMETIGKLFGKEDEVKAELAEVNASIEEIKEQAAAKDEKTLIIMGNEEKVSAYGPSSRFGIIHDVFGFKPADVNIEKSTHGQSISFEYVMEQNPDILFVIDRDSAFDPNASVKQAVENDIVKKTNAYKNDKIVYLNGGPWYLAGGGLQSIKIMIEDVKAGL